MSNTIKIVPLGNRTAFPFITTEDFVEGQLGLTKREWFAGQALAGLCANPVMTEILSRAFNDTPTRANNQVAGMAVNFADTTLAELAKEKK